MNFDSEIRKLELRIDSRIGQDAVALLAHRGIREGQERFYSGKVVGISWWGGTRSRHPHEIWEDYPDWTYYIDVGERFLVSFIEIRKPLDLRVGEPVGFTAYPVVDVLHGVRRFCLSAFLKEKNFQTGRTDSCKSLEDRLVLFLMGHKVDWERHHQSAEYLARLERELDGDYDLWG